jgi:hypothetical protein
MLLTFINLVMFANEQEDLPHKSLAKLVTTFLEEPFVKWGFYVIRLIKQIGYCMKNEYVAIKCVKVKILCTNIVIMTSKFLCEFILTKFGRFFIIIIHQAVHFYQLLNYNHFMLKHVNSPTYYSHGNGQTKFTNKVINTLITKLVNDNKGN